MWLTIGSTVVRDGEIDMDELTARLGEGINTSGPTPGEFAEAIKGADTGDGVVVLTLSKEMSSTHESALLAARLTGGDVRVLDTGTAAGAQGLVVLAAAKASQEGATLAQVVDAAEAARRSAHLVATLTSLEQLVRSGRVPGAAGWAGRWLGVNPMFEFRAGKVRPLRPALSRAAARERMVAMMANQRDGDGSGDLRLAVMHASDPKAAELLLGEACSKERPVSHLVGPFSPVMVAHTGTGLLGLAWWREQPPPSPSGEEARRGLRMG